MKVNRDYIIGAFIGGAAVSLLNIPRVSSLEEDSKEQQAQYTSKVQELDRQIRQAQTKDEIIELQRQQSLVDKAEIDSLRKANESLYDRIRQLESRPEKDIAGVNLDGMYKIANQWRMYSMHLANQLKNNGIRHTGSKEFYPTSVRMDPWFEEPRFLTFEPFPHVNGYDGR